MYSDEESAEEEYYDAEEKAPLYSSIFNGDTGGSEMGALDVLINTIALPASAALATTALSMIPKLEKVPLIGYFRKTIGFLCIVSWLITFILIIILQNNNIVIGFATQTIILSGILAGAVVYNLYFGLDKPPMTGEEMAVSIKQIYTEGMNEYLTKKMGVSKTKAYFSDILNKMVARVSRTPDDTLSFQDKETILSPVYDQTSGTTDNPFIKVTSLISKLADTYSGVNYKKEAATSNDIGLVASFLGNFTTPLDTTNAPGNNATFKESYEYIDALKLEYDTVSTDKVLIEECIRKIKLLLCGTTVFEADDQTVNDLRTDFSCSDGFTNSPEDDVERFYQETTPIQELIDSGKL